MDSRLIHFHRVSLPRGGLANLRPIRYSNRNASSEFHSKDSRYTRNALDRGFSDPNIYELLDALCCLASMTLAAFGNVATDSENVPESVRSSGRTGIVVGGPKRRE